jgi:hypothetical protein
MNFKTFQSNCKYAQYGLKQDTVRDFELTCRKPGCVPKGCSWGVCDEAHCPYFGIKCKSGVAIDIKTGEVLFSLDNCRVVIGT